MRQQVYLFAPRAPSLRAAKKSRMKPEKWVELQLSNAYGVLERHGVVAVATDSRFHLAVLAFAIVWVGWKIFSISRSKRLASEAALRERREREEARAREKREKAEKKRRRHVVGCDKDVVVVAADVVPAPRATAVRRDKKQEKDDDGDEDADADADADEEDPEDDYKKKSGRKAPRQPYMARLARAALGTTTSTSTATAPEWDYEREWEDEQRWRREAAAADRQQEWTPAQVDALKTSIRQYKSEDYPTREARFRAIAEDVGCGKSWMQCAAKFVELRDAALELRRARERETRREQQVQQKGKEGKQMKKNASVGGKDGGGYSGGGSSSVLDVTGIFGFSGGGGGSAKKNKEKDDEDDTAYDDDHDDHDENGEDEDADEAEEDDDEDDSELLPLDLTPKPSGTVVSLEGTQATGVSAVRPQALAVTLQCVRCKARQDVTLSGCVTEAAAATLWCEGCSCILRASIRPCLFVPGGGVVGGTQRNPLAYFDLENCEVADVLPSALRASCGACDRRASQPLRAPFVRDRVVRDNCGACGAGMSFIARNIAVKIVTPAVTTAAAAMGGVRGRGRGGGGKRSGGGGGDDEDDEDLQSRLERHRSAGRGGGGGGPAIQEGTSLPNMGRCAHFRRSLRWLRFPCCGKAYACAICHESSDCPAASMGVWANRMICGQCSKEQGYSPDKPCSGCGFKMGQGGSKSNWNGGGGMRDLMRLSKKDSRKKDASWDAKKTVSRKAQQAKAGGGPPKGKTAGGNKYQGNRNR